MIHVHIKTDLYNKLQNLAVEGTKRNTEYTQYFDLRLMDETIILKEGEAVEIYDENDLSRSFIVFVFRKQEHSKDNRYDFFRTLNYLSES